MRPSVSLRIVRRRRAATDELPSSRRYSRSANPTRLAYERLIASLEGADVLLAAALREQGVTDPAKFEAGPGGLAFASGSAATATAIQALAGQGGHIVSVGDVYGGTSRCVPSEPFSRRTQS